MNEPTLFYGYLSERTGAANDACFNAALDVAEHAGINRYKHFRLGYNRVDFARNEFCKTFLKLSTRDNDMLVMLDCDHKHPADITSRLFSHPYEHGVVGALAYRRGEPFDPLFFIRTGAALHSLAEFEKGVTYPCAIVSTCAIGIRRWVLLELEHKGYSWPFFRYEYPTNQALPSEDMYFGRICEQAGIWHYCDTSIISPHARVDWSNEQLNAAYLAQHPELVSGEKVEIVA